MKEIIIDKKYEGIRFDKYLEKLLINCNTNFIYKMLRKKNILLNDKLSKGYEKLKIGDKINIFFKDETYQKFTEKNNNNNINIDNRYIDLFKNNIIYEDNNLLIIDKWDGIKSQNDEKDNISINTLFLDYMKDKANDDLYNASIINRLDTNTKGLMICAKNYKTSKVLTEAIKNNYLKKYYKLIVNGIFDDKKDTIKLYMKKDGLIASISDIQQVGYKQIETKYKIINTFDNYTILEATLVTGKFHQIRASFSHIGYPLVLDRKYSNRELYIDNKKHFKGKDQLLISYKLVFESIDDEDYKYLENKMFFSKYNIEDFIKNET